MIITIGQINPKNARTTRLCRALFWLAVLFSFADLAVYSQPTLMNKNREKDFGKSLTKKTDAESKDKNDPRDNETIRIETNNVLADTLVVDNKGNVIFGLKREDFIVSENDVPQNIETFSVGAGADLPRSIILLIDYSGSMRPYISTSIEAAKSLVDKLRPADRMAIVTDDIDLVSDFAKDKNLLKSKLNSIEKKVQEGRLGKSLQFSALFAALIEMFSEEDPQRIVIFQSDGDEYTFLKPIDPEWKKIYHSHLRRQNESSVSYLQLKSAVENARATIYSVIPGVRFVGAPERELLQRGYRVIMDGALSNPYLMESPFLRMSTIEDNAKKEAPLWAQLELIQQGSMVDIAKFSGGFTEFLENPNDAGAIYTKILNVIESRYQIGYYSKNDVRDGKRRSVKIEVINHPEYTVLGRKTYIPRGH